MKHISQLSVDLSNALQNKKKDLIEAQRNTAKKIWEDVIEDAPVRSGTYISSIKISDTVVTENKISTSIYSDLKVGGDNPKWQNVPLACLLEWGTGIQGAITNTFNHGYPYTLNPWTYYDKYLHMYVTTDGMVARPHFLPSLHKNESYYLEQIKEAMKK